MGIRSVSLSEPANAVSSSATDAAQNSGGCVPARAPRTRNVQSTEQEPGADEIRNALGRIVASATFRDSFRLSCFLHFVVTAALAGRSSEIKAYTVAVEALGRGSDFDAQSDPIVRVEAGRLRQALRRYYEGPGWNDPLLIDLPRGGYVPSFRRRSVHSSTGPPQRGEPSEFVADATAATERPLNNDQRVLQAISGRLADMQRQIAAMATEIATAITTLRGSGTAQKRNSAVRLPPPNAAATNRAVPEGTRTADGRQTRKTQQAQGPPAARTGRPRPG